MLDPCSTSNEIIDASQLDGRGLKHTPHWPPVNIDFEDIIYKIENGQESKYRIIKFDALFKLNF